MIYIGIAAVIALIALRLAVRTWRRGSKNAVSGQTDPIPRELYEFLEKADDAYILTHQTTDIRYFSLFATNTVCNGILDAIYKNPPIMFGIKQHRTRAWRIVEQRREELLIHKQITHVQVEVKQGIKVALGDDLVELWKVSQGPLGYRVEEVS